MRHGSAGFMAQVTGTSEMLANGLTAVFGGAVTEPLKIMACLAGAFCISWQLTLACLTLAPAVGFMMVWLNRRIRRVSKNILTRSLGFHHVLLEAFNNVLTVQAYTMEDFERERFRSCTRDMLKIGMRHGFYFALANPITEVLGIGMVATSIAVGAWLVINQQTEIFGITMTDRPMTVPGIMVFFGMLIGASDPVRKLSGVLTGLNMGVVGAQALYPLLDTADLAHPASRDPAARRVVQLRRDRHRRAERERFHRFRRAGRDRRAERWRQEHAREPHLQVLRPDPWGRCCSTACRSRRSAWPTCGGGSPW